MKTKKIHIYFVLFVTVVLVQVVCVPRAHAGAKLNLSKASNNNGLVGYWTFDGVDTRGGAIRDISGLANDGAVFGIATSTFYTLGKMGQALNFDGVDDFILLPDSVSLSPTLEVSISVWLNFRENRSQTIIVKQEEGGLDTPYWLKTDGSSPNKITFERYDGGGLICAVTSAASIPLNEWHHVVVTADAVSNLLVYIDGSQSGSCVGTIPASGNGIQPSVGGYYGSEMFSGKMDDLRMYDRMLSALEIQRLYNAGKIKTALTPKSLVSGLMHHWTFDGKDVNATTAYDRVGTAHGTLATALVKMPRPTVGPVGQAMSLQADGSANQGYIDFGTATDLATMSKMSISMWVRRKAFSPYGGGQILGKQADGSGWGFKSFNSGSDDDDVAFLPTGPDGANYGNTTTKPLQIGKWVHLVLVYDGAGATNQDKIRIYTNGNAETLAYVGTIDSAALGNGNLLIGEEVVGGGLFAGDVDDVRIYGRGLTAEEVRRLYNVGNTVINTAQKINSIPGLVGLWTFDGKSLYQNVADSSGTGNAGYIVGVTSTSSMARLGKAGQAMAFSGATGASAQYISILPNSSLNMTDAVSMCLWVKTNTGTNTGLAVKSDVVTGASTAQPDYGFIIVGAGQYRWVINQQVANIQTGVNAIPNATWGHLCGTYDKQNLYLYLNGEFVTSAAYTTSINVTGSSQAYLGVYYSTTYTYNGTLDDVRIYNRALSADEVRKIYRGYY